MQQITFNKTFVVSNEKESDEYGKLVNDVAKLISRPFFVTFRMVEQWEPGELAAVYDDCVTKWRNRGFNSPSHMFWTIRKQKNDKLHVQKQKDRVVQ